MTASENVLAGTPSTAGILLRTLVQALVGEGVGPVPADAGVTIHPGAAFGQRPNPPEGHSAC